MQIRSSRHSFDAAYEAYISEEDVPHSIYECEGARTCAIELRSFSKNAGFTGTRLGYTVIPKDLKSDGIMLHSLWARRHGTKYNGAPYIVQKAGEAVYSEAGRKQVAEQVAYYMKSGDDQAGASGSRLYRIWRRKFSVYLAENAGEDDFMGVL